MISEEEKEAIEIIKKEITKPETTSLEVYITDIKMLLNIINKQQKEINELKCAITSQSKHISQDQKEIEEYKETINVLKPNLEELIAMSNFAMQKDYVSKSKIKDKIREIEDKMQEDETDDFGNHTIGWAALDYCCDRFKELLEENINE